MLLPFYRFISHLFSLSSYCLAYPLIILSFYFTFLSLSYFIFIVYCYTPCLSYIILSPYCQISFLTLFYFIFLSLFTYLFLLSSYFISFLPYSSLSCYHLVNSSSCWHIALKSPFIFVLLAIHRLKIFVFDNINICTFCSYLIVFISLQWKIW